MARLPFLSASVSAVPRAASLVSVLTLAAVGCGGPEAPRTLVDESQDLIIAEPSSRHLAGTTPVGPEIAGTQWQWREAHCTEGPLELPGFSRTTRLKADSTGLLLTHDDLVQGDDGVCRRTSVQHATPGSDADAQWSMSEQAVIDVGHCDDKAEADRPGDVRMRGNELEVYVQRSVWCGGLELRMVYAPMQPTELDDLSVALHYAAHFNRRDAVRLTELFAPTGSLVDPFTRTPLDQAVRFDGQAQVFAWFQEMFSATPWVAMRVVSLDVAAPGLVILDWHYMDPRLDGPFAGRNRFTVATGQIFETSIEITAEEVSAEVQEAELVNRVQETSAAETPAAEAPAAPEGASPEATTEPAAEAPAGTEDVPTAGE